MTAIFNDLPIESVLGEPYEGFEMICVDDGTTEPGWPEILRIIRQADSTSCRDDAEKAAYTIATRSKS